MDDLSARSLARRTVAAMREHDQGSAWLGVEVKSVDVGAATVTMRVRAEMLNGHGTCHGGFLFALADSVFGFACNSRNAKTVAAGGQIDFLRPALLGDELRAEAIERALGGQLGVYDVRISNQRGEIVALFRGKSCRVPGTVIAESAER
jgi:acyl-CoA thioesterase